MNRFVRAIAHALQRLASLLLGLAGDEDVASPWPVRAEGSPPPDWLRRMRRDPPRDWLERVRRGRPRWMGGSTPAAPPRPATVVDMDDPEEAATPQPYAPQQTGGEMPANVTLPRRAGGRSSSTPHPDPLPYGGKEKGRVGGEILEAPTPHRKPPPRGGRGSAGRVGGEITERSAPSPDPPPQWGTLRSARMGGQIAEAAARQPAPPSDGESVNPRTNLPEQGAGETDLEWGVVRLLNPDPPLQRERERNAVYEIEELDAPTQALPREQGREIYPWPDLPADPPADAGDPATIVRGMERRERLAREQRGD